MHTTTRLASTRPRSRRPRSALVALAATLLLLASSVTPAAAIGLGNPATLDEVLTSAGYDKTHADVLRLYQAFFEREPDVDGAVYWIEQYEAGATLDDLAWGFASSTEFTSRYGGDLTNRQFLEIVYGNVLGRTPDDEGMDYWLGQVDGGLSQHGVVRWVAANDEFAATYPFAPELVGITPASFLTSADLPTGWTAEVNEIETGLDRTSCPNRLIPPGNAVVATYQSADASAFLEQGVAAFDSVDAAEAYLENFRDYVTSCPDFVDSNGDRNVPAPLTFRPVGDSSASFREVVTTAGTTDRYERHMVSWRVGRVLVIVWSSAELGDLATVLDAAVDLIEPRVLADIS